MKPTLTLTFDPGYGRQKLSMCLPLGEDIAAEIERLQPPRKAAVAFLGMSLDDVVSVLRRKEFRKDLFLGEATRLGALLAERMEDAEGWHDASRIEPAKRELGIPEQQHDSWLV